MSSVHVQGHDGRAEHEQHDHEQHQQQDQAGGHNVLTFGPVPFGWLSVPLTRERAAAVARFEARHGVKITDVITDFMDDQVFALSEGQVPCVQGTRSFPQSSGKSNERSCEAPHDCASRPSDEPARVFGPQAPPQNLHRASNAPSEQQNMNWPATANLPADPSPQSSPKYPSGRSNGCGND